MKKTGTFSMNISKFFTTIFITFVNLGTGTGMGSLRQSMSIYNNSRGPRRVSLNSGPRTVSLNKRYIGKRQGDTGIIECAVDENPLNNVLYKGRPSPLDEDFILEDFVISELDVFTDTPQLKEACGNYIVQPHGLVKLNVHSMMNYEDDPHHYHVTPADLAAIEKADVAVFERKPAFEVSYPHVILQEVIGEIAVHEHLAFHLQSYLITRHIMASVCTGSPSSCDKDSILKRGVYYDRKENQCLYLPKCSSEDFKKYYPSTVEKSIALLNAEGGFNLPASLPTEGVKYYSFESIIDPLFDLYKVDCHSIYSGSRSCSHHGDDDVNYLALSKKIGIDLVEGDKIVLICTVQTERKLQSFLDSALTDKWVNRENVRIVTVDEMMPSDDVEKGIGGISRWVNKAIMSLLSDAADAS